jgi:hypothetical protein
MIFPGSNSNFSFQIPEIAISRTRSYVPDRFTYFMTRLGPTSAP